MLGLCWTYGSCLLHLSCAPAGASERRGSEALQRGRRAVKRLTSWCSARCRDRSAAHHKDVSIPSRDRQYSYWLVLLAALDLSTAPRAGLYWGLYWTQTGSRLCIYLDLG